MRLLWQQIPNALVSELLAKSKFDGVVLDTEHGVFSNETLYNCIQTITNCNKKCFVRVTEPDKTFVRYCLDTGVDGLIFSTVESLEQVRDIELQCYFPPKGTRGYGLTRDNFWGETDRKEQPIIIAQIETHKGVITLTSATSRFLDVFDYFMIGPYDLSSSLGTPGNFETDQYKKHIEQIKKDVGIRRMGYHIVKDIEKQYPDLKDCGLLAISMDTLMIIDGIKGIERYS